LANPQAGALTLVLLPSAALALNHAVQPAVEKLKGPIAH
jgi:hypothetical protein